VIALRSMEKGLLDPPPWAARTDRRVTMCTLTPSQAHARLLRSSSRAAINAQADDGISSDDIAVFRRVIHANDENLDKVG
jgi:hypothetical protein